MKKFILLLAIISCSFLHAQNLSLSAGLGTTTYAGDLQAKGFNIHLSNFSFSAGAAYKFSSHVSAGINLFTGKVYASDSDFSGAYIKRNLSFHSNIFDVNAQVEYDFLKLEKAGDFTPYIFAGVGFFHFNPYTYDNSAVKTYLQPLGTEGQGLQQYPDKKIYALTQFNIPFGAGIKFNLTEQLAAGFEVDFRKLFTDYLDDVSTTYADSLALLNGRGAKAVELAFRGDELKPPIPFPKEGDVRGNPAKKDTYTFMILRLTYTFPQSGFGGFGKHSKYSLKQNGCPKKIL